MFRIYLAALIRGTSTKEMDNSWSAIILTGGTSKRFGSDKTEAKIAGRALIDHLIESIPGHVPIIVVGPARDNFESRIQVTQETPALGGPVAAIAAGLELVRTELAAVFAADMPFAPLLIPQLMNAMSYESDAVLPIDFNGFVQPLCALYRVDALAKALLTFEAISGQSMRNLLAGLRVAHIEVDNPGVRSLIDIDTQEDLIKAIYNFEDMSTISTNEMRK
jgi:molybdopterin-guanine dinucleotide biosynthesis protein A